MKAKFYWDLGHGVILGMTSVVTLPAIAMGAINNFAAPSDGLERFGTFSKRRALKLPMELR